MKSWARLVVAGIALALCGCKSLPHATPQAQIAHLAGTSWLADSIRGKATSPQIESTLEIDDQAQVRGVGGCNAYVSDVGIESDTIRFSEPSAANLFGAATNASPVNAAIFFATRSPNSPTW